MRKQEPLNPSARADNPAQDSLREDYTHEIAPDLAYKRLIIVNVAFHGLARAGSESWVLIDAGLPGTAGAIAKAGGARFGVNSRPFAILLTHGHFDHVGALKTLLERWDVPVYAHPLEAPFLTGNASYPAPDPTVGGGLMARMAAIYPRGPVNVSRWLRPLPADHAVPGLPEWTWIHTPGHTPGHVSFWRESDRSLIAGDAFITTNQESAYAVAMQAPELHGPPMYYTPDWEASETSVQRLAALEPELVVTGHGRAMRGPDMRSALRDLAQDFRRVALPEHGRYVKDRATVEGGTAYRPPR
jgi:glyoxylase-like metal-dependent hydrolase (beta-lactamase superfamily II)